MSHVSFICILVPSLLKINTVRYISANIAHNSTNKISRPIFSDMEQRYAVLDGQAVLGVRQIFWPDVFQICQIYVYTPYSVQQSRRDRNDCGALSPSRRRTQSKHAIVIFPKTDIFVIFLSNAYAIKLTVYLDTESGKHRQLLNLSDLAISL